jgi:hypothetical protein
LLVLEYLRKKYKFQTKKSPFSFERTGAGWLALANVEIERNDVTLKLSKGA